MQQIIFRGRDGQQHILQQPYQPGAPGSNQAGPQQQWPFRQAGPPASPGPQIVIQQQVNEKNEKDCFVLDLFEKVGIYDYHAKKIDFIRLRICSYLKLILQD